MNTLMQMPKTEPFAKRQQGHVYIHEIEIVTDAPMHMKVHAIMLHFQPFYHDTDGFMRTSFVTLDVYRDNLYNAMITLKEALPRFIMVEAEIDTDNLVLLSPSKEQGIPRTVGELVGIGLAVMKCRAGTS